VYDKLNGTFIIGKPDQSTHAYNAMYSDVKYTNGKLFSGAKYYYFLRAFNQVLIYLSLCMLYFVEELHIVARDMIKRIGYAANRVLLILCLVPFCSRDNWLIRQSRAIFGRILTNRK